MTPGQSALPARAADKARVTSCPGSPEFDLMLFSLMQDHLHRLLRNVRLASRRTPLTEHNRRHHGERRIDEGERRTPLESWFELFLTSFSVSLLVEPDPGSPAWRASPVCEGRASTSENWRRTGELDTVSVVYWIHKFVLQKCRTRSSEARKVPTGLSPHPYLLMLVTYGICASRGPRPCVFDSVHEIPDKSGGPHPVRGRVVQRHVGIRSRPVRLARANWLRLGDRSLVLLPFALPHPLHSSSTLP